ncbi:hypothetical protein [Deinococcus roseus]|nr:hypothetical protein [Deinococcus roseus]
MMFKPGKIKQGLFLALLLTACAQVPRPQTIQATQPPATDELVMPQAIQNSKVFIQVSSTVVELGSTVSLYAVPQQLGLITREVTWKVVSGPGTVSGGKNATFTAPTTGSGQTILQATSTENSALTGQVALNLTPKTAGQDVIQLTTNVAFSYDIVSVHVTSTYEVVEVTASVPNGPSTTLSKTGTNLYSGNLPLKGLPRGEQRIWVKVKDVKGNQQIRLYQFIADRNPALNVDYSLDDPYLVAADFFPVNASCTDDSGSCRITVKRNTVPVLSGVGSVNGSVDMQAFAGQVYPVSVIADDPGGNTLKYDFQVYVPNASLNTKMLVPGTIYDVDATRVLYTKAVPNGTTKLKYRSFATGVDTTLTLPLNGVPIGGKLFPDGVIYRTRPLGGGISWLFDSRDPGTNLTPSGHNWYAVSGYYLAYRTNDSQTFLRNLQTNTTTFLGTGLTGDLAPNGRLVSAPKLTDGTHDVYPVSNSTGVAIALFDGTQQILLRNYRLNGKAEIGVDYAVNNGYAAYTDYDSNGNRQVWLRLPTGAKVRKTFTSVSNVIAALGPNGELIVRRLGPGDLYTIDTAGNEKPLGLITRPYFVKFVDGKWNIVIFNGVFEPKP